MTKLYVVFSGHICAGKSTLIQELKNHNNLRNLGDIHFLEEAVNHDKLVLDAYYADPKSTAFSFEISTLGARLTLGNSIKKQKDIVIGDRNIIEARETFVKYNHDKKIISDSQLIIYDQIIIDGVNSGLLRSPDLVIFLDVPNVDILIERQKGRLAPGEKNLDLKYINDLAPYFSRYKDNFENAYWQAYRLRVPRLEILDASNDVQSLAERCEQVITEMYGVK